MAGIIKSMLEFSFAGDRGCSPMLREEVDINTLLRKAVSLNQHEALYKNIDIEMQLVKDLPPVKDYGLEQVFMNFIKNSLDSIESDGKIIIKNYRLIYLIRKSQLECWVMARRSAMAIWRRKCWISSSINPPVIQTGLRAH